MISQKSTETPTQRSPKRLCSLDDVGLFVKAQSIANVVFEYVGADLGDAPEFDIPRLKDVRLDPDALNPFYCQTADGFYLELCDDCPSRLWTPWGRWDFGFQGRGAWYEVLPAILMRLKASEYAGKYPTYLGMFGPVYALYKVDAIELPHPVELQQKAYAKFEEAMWKWEHFLTELNSFNVNAELPLF